MRTERRPHRVDERLGLVSRRSSYAALVALLLPLLLVLPRPAAAIELLSWWRRDLLEPTWEVGDWATYAQTEWTEDGVFADTVTVRVLPAVTADARWIEIENLGRGGADRILLRPDALRGSDDPLAAIDSLLHREADGPWIVDDVEAYREQRLVQRHLQDPFVDPVIARAAVADTTIGGTKHARFRFELAETRDESRSLGASTLVVTTRLRASAVVSPDVPLAGILSAHSLSTVTTTTEGAGSKRSRRAAPPLVTERRIECLDFGRIEADSDAP